MKRIIIGLLWIVVIVLGNLDEKKESGYQRADPGTLTLIAIAAAVGGTVMSVQAQRQQTKATKATAKYNAALAQQKADETRKIGALKTEARRKKARQLSASQRAGFGKAGVTLTGTPFTVMTETAKNEALNALLIGRESEISARGLESQSSLYGTQATNIGRAGRLAVGAELFGGVGSTIMAASAAQSLKKKKDVA